MLSRSHQSTICLILTFLILPTALAQEAKSTNETNKKQPLNFVFFLVDDLGYMDVGCNNPKTFYETPNIDSLAKQGVRFTNGYAANPVCSPTRFSIMTGKYPSRADATNFFGGRRPELFAPAKATDRMPLTETTLAQALKESGNYATFFAGKWHLGPTEEYWPENRGFDVNRAGWREGGPYGPGRYFVPYGNPRLTDGPEGEHLPDRLATEACAFIEQNKNQPFLTYIAFYSVHTPLVSRPDLIAKYEAKAKTLGLDQIPRPEQFTEEEQAALTDRARRVRSVQTHTTYAAMVESMDLAIGKVISKLDELGLTENTAIIVMSDNGGLASSEGSPTSNLPLRGGKGWVYEGGIREPFIIRWPGVADHGRTENTPVISTDFYPTILEMAGLPAQPTQHLDGISLVPLLRAPDENTPVHDALYWHYPHYSNQGGFPGGAIRIGDWKLIERYEDGQVNLYNLGTDLGELHDLAAQNPERVETMRAQLHAWYIEVDARFLEPRTDGKGGDAHEPKLIPWRP